jgi:hypothetical protein
MTSRASKKWKWVLDVVDPGKEHIKITYGKIKHGQIAGNVRQPVALVAPGRDKTFLVQFLVDKDEKTKKIVDEISRELNFYLVEKGEENPWAYAQYHCGTASNLYSSVHWSYYPEGSEKDL